MIVAEAHLFSARYDIGWLRGVKPVNVERVLFTGAGPVYTE